MDQFVACALQKTPETLPDSNMDPKIGKIGVRNDLKKYKNEIGVGSLKKMSSWCQVSSFKTLYEACQ